MAKKTSKPSEVEEEETLTPEMLEQFKARLKEERTKVLGNLKTHVSDAIQDPDKFADESDQASQQVSQTFLLRLADKERKLLNEIDNALGKFEDDSYGYCEGTGDPISVKRLELRPWTRYSVEYKQVLEKEKKLRGS
jgi:DnaK suppressor protein